MLLNAYYSQKYAICQDADRSCGTCDAETELQTSEQLKLHSQVIGEMAWQLYKFKNILLLLPDSWYM